MIKEFLYKINNIRYSIPNFFTGLKRWFSYFKVLTNIYDFDYTSILAVEKYQLIRVRNNIEKYKNHVNWKIDVQHINLALKLLNIIEEDGVSKSSENFFDIDENRYLKRNPNSKWIMPIYVNTRNSKRFNLDKLNFEDSKIGPLYQDYLRIEKAWYLYNKVRIYFLRNWWD